MKLNREQKKKSQTPDWHSNPHENLEIRLKICAENNIERVGFVYVYCESEILEPRALNGDKKYNINLHNKLSNLLKNFLSFLTC